MLVCLLICSCLHVVGRGEQPTTTPMGIVDVQPAAGHFVPCRNGFMVAYRQTIPGTKIAFEMVPIPAGTFHLGSPPSERQRRDDEGPQASIDVPACWMGKYEVTWAEYKSFMKTYDLVKKLQSQGKRQVNDENRLDAVTIPTPLYDPSYTYAIGEEARQPAVTMSQYAAKQYTKWLSLLTGVMYRLPSEAEWEYACRAGSQTAYAFGDDPGQLGEYAWYFDNSDDVTHPVGQKKANAWGLYDMHGNVGELCLDQYDADRYAKLAKAHPSSAPVPASDAVAWPSKLFPRVVRGGNWMDDADRLRSAVRTATADWRMEDPNLPKSPWWFTDEEALGVGFRIVRPLAPPPRVEQERFWKSDVEPLEAAIENRLSEGRGAIVPIDPGFPQDVETSRP